MIFGKRILAAVTSVVMAIGVCSFAALAETEPVSVPLQNSLPYTNDFDGKADNYTPVPSTDGMTASASVSVQGGKMQATANGNGKSVTLNLEAITSGTVIAEFDYYANNGNGVGYNDLVSFLDSAGEQVTRVYGKNNSKNGIQIWDGADSYSGTFSPGWTNNVTKVKMWANLDKSTWGLDINEAAINLNDKTEWSFMKADATDVSVLKFGNGAFFYSGYYIDNIKVYKEVTATQTETEYEIVTGEEKTLELTYASDVDVYTDLEWSSDNTAAVTVDSAGKVTGEEEGMANITAYTPFYDKTFEWKVNCRARAESITFNPAEITLNVGESSSLSYTASPEGGLIKNAVWSSADEAVATVSDGVVTAEGKGETIVSVTLMGGFKADVKVKVVVPVTALSFENSSYSLKKGSSLTLSPILTPANANEIDFVWQSSNQYVATVTDGVVKGVAAGVATIRAYSALDDTVYAECSVTITASSGGGGGGGGGGSRTPGKVSFATGKVDSTTELDEISKVDEAEMKKALNQNGYSVTKFENKSVEIPNSFFADFDDEHILEIRGEGFSALLNGDALKLNEDDKVVIDMSFNDAEKTLEFSVEVNGKEIEKFNKKTSFAVNYTVSPYMIPSVTDGAGAAVESMVDGESIVFAVTVPGTYKVGERREYADVADFLWAEAEINNAIINKEIVPDSKNKFGAARAITRSEFVAAIMRAALFEKQEAEITFTDITKKNSYYKDVVSAYSYGIIKGVSETSFMPDASITRQDAAVVLYNALKTKGVSLADVTPDFPDAAEISDYAVYSVGALTDIGILEGKPEGFEPKANITKAETAMLVERVKQLLK